MVFSPINPWTFPVNPNFPWLPAINFITNITNSNPAVITTATAHGFHDSLFIRIVFPQTFAPVFGMTQINNQTGQVTVIDSVTFAIDIDTSKYNAFVVSLSDELPQVVPIGVTAQSSINDSTQVNPPDPPKNVRIFQPIAPQCHGPCNVP